MTLALRPVDASAPPFRRAASEDLYAHIVAPPSLFSAWTKIAAKGGCAGGDGITLRRFAANAPAALADLNRRLCEGTYVPGPPRVVLIPKPNGGERRLVIPSIADRIVQCAVARALTPRFDPGMSESSFGYRPRRSAAMAIARVVRLHKAGYGHVVEGDIEHFFDSVEHNRLVPMLDAALADPCLAALIRSWLGALAPDGCGLPQGAPISPVLSNLFLDPFDRAIRGSGMRLVRYADDFLLLCRSAAEAESARDRAGELLAELGLRLNFEKSRITSFTEGFGFLGRRFVRGFAWQAPKETPANNDPAVPENPFAAPAAGDEKQLDRRNRPVMRVLYLRRPGRHLAGRGEAFTVVEGERPLAVIPLSEVDRVEIGPANTISNSALRLAIARGVPIAFVDGWNRTCGVCRGFHRHSAALHLAQARCVIDETARIDLARRIVEGRLRNERALLHRLCRGREEPAVGQAIAAIRRCERRLAEAGTIAQLMGFEGSATAAYWQGWGRLLAPGWTFRKRTRHPPRDPVNAILSFLAAMLHRDIGALAERHGLHPGFGMLHGSRDGAAGCVSDLIEEFRAPLIEGFAAYIINNRVLAPGLFAIGTGGCRILAPGHERLVRGYERWLDRPVRSPRSGRRIRWRRLIEEQVLAYVRHCRREEPYRPYAMDF